MFSFSSGTTTQLVVDTGFSFEGHFRQGVECILVRYEAPQFHIPDSMPLELVRDHIESCNEGLSGAYMGKGYYAFDPVEEMDHPGHHVLVLYSDADFYNAFLGSVESESLPPCFGGLVQLSTVIQGLLP